MSSTAVAVGERMVGVGDLQVRVSHRGTGAPLVVLHHSTGPFWSRFHDLLSQAFAVMAPDAPGYGGSTRPETARHPSHLAVLLQQWLDVEGLDGVHLVGTGMGGWIAAEMAAMNQRRLASLTLIGAAGMKPLEGMIHDPMAESWGDYGRRSFRDDEHFAAVFGEVQSDAINQLWDFSREMTARVAWKPYMWSLQLPTLLAAVTVPSLVIWGGADRVVPIECAHRYVATLPNATLQVVEGAGHAVELEEPARVAEHVINHARS
jgi:pimeloyl-ACP methyl ester carboxylesterase